MYDYGNNTAQFLFLSTLPARGATFGAKHICNTSSYFYPRSPRGERPIRTAESLPSGRISIHAPREGSDEQST